MVLPIGVNNRGWKDPSGFSVNGPLFLAEILTVLPADCQAEPFPKLLPDLQFRAPPFAQLQVLIKPASIGLTPGEIMPIIIELRLDIHYLLEFMGVLQGYITAIICR